MKHMDAEARFEATRAALATFTEQHVRTANCSYVMPEPGGTGPLSASYPKITHQLRENCNELTVTRYTIEWNLGFWFLREAANGRTYGGRVLEISGKSSLRRYLVKPGTTFEEAIYPAVDVTALHKAYPRESFDMVIAESVLEHVFNPQLAAFQAHRVLRPGGHFLMIVPSQYPHHFGPFDYWRMSTSGLKTLAAPFGRVAMCGSHRSAGLAALLTQPDYPDNLRIYPSRNRKAAAIVSEAPKATAACNDKKRCKRIRDSAAVFARRGLEPDGTPKKSDGTLRGDPRYGDLVVSSWLMAEK